MSPGAKSGQGEVTRRFVRLARRARPSGALILAAVSFRSARELWHDAQREIERYRREVDPALEQRRGAPPERELA